MIGQFVHCWPAGAWIATVTCLGPGWVSTSSHAATDGARRTRIAAPADLDDKTTAAVRDLGTRVFTMAGCSGLARCDFFVEEPAAGESGQARILLNEINTIPGFTRTSVYAKLWEATGLPYPDLCNRLAELALDRHKSESDYTF